LVVGGRCKKSYQWLVIAKGLRTCLRFFVFLQLAYCFISFKGDESYWEALQNSHILCYAWVQGNNFFLITPTILFYFSFSSICFSVLCYCYVFEGDINEFYMINFSYLLNIFCFAIFFVIWYIMDKISMQFTNNSSMQLASESTSWWW